MAASASESPPLPSSPSPAPSPSPADRQRRVRRVALALFFVYLAFYAGFMGWNVAAPISMARPMFLGMNLAIVYGFGLIVAALVLALVYVTIANRPAPPASAAERP